ncbi:oxalate/formate MFS antiporter [Methylobacterium aerolatum]|uniref:OFA family oxalate/formate antiporter-like MFS transporter n=1 Tax=Methylobacterium aerolatum TaxID=418708 RepID=A0ABU0HW49_9HYPH|nr:oxalate/formate MFS antiporter [Methylobacterium aerolatum]MDQ0446053.1 OFA family oxalate/formate antiporter-like MFS transporter [Methylobacterium aerolatum]GJD35089.1 Oxalate:formate antiporter [Methylobacterium aerolatum]
MATPFADPVPGPTAAVGVPAGIDTPVLGRWGQLALGVLCMSMIANMQYGWTLFVNPINDKYQWGKPAIQVAFTIFVLTETWLVPIEGWFVDRYGPKVVTLIGGALCALGWTMNAYAESLPMLYAAAAVGGIGAGAVYGTCVGNALKWFPDRRGLAAGLTAAGFGAGSALTVVPIAAMIRDSGYEHTFLVFGLGQGLIVMIASLLLTAPRAGYKDRMLAGRATPNAVTRRQYGPSEMVRTPVFWLMYLMFVLMAAGGLMATASLAPIAKDFKVDGVPVSILGLTLPALTFALTIDRILNGVTRPFFGWVSDRIGRENTMVIAFTIEGVGILALGLLAHNPFAFVLLTGLVFFAWGEIYSLFPSTCADTYGDQKATANAGLLYTAKGTASLLLPAFLLIQSQTGSWQNVFYLASGMAFLAAFLALFVLKPMRARFVAKSL